MTRPNILFIISDDHGYGDISWEGGNEDVHTPNLERLAARGVSFRQGYVSAPICSPSRSGLITGAYQQRWGGRWFDSSAFPPPERPTMAELLGDLGYRTGYFGKIHYGGSDDYGTRSCPDQHGFREAFYGLASLSMGRLHYMRHSEQDLAEYGPERSRVHGVQPMVHNGQKVDCHEHLTIEFARRAIDFMSDPVQGLGEGQQEDEQRPFFCMVAFNAVHNFTWQLPQWKLDERGLPSHPEFDPDTNGYLDWYDGAIWPNLDHGREYYLGQLELMDAQIGRLLDHLEETGQIDNTIIVYLTDNGGSTCNFGNNAPLAGTKYTLHEGGVRVPYVIAGPGVKEPGSLSQALVSSLDLLPTFVAAAGGEVPEGVPFDGVDLGAVLRGETETAHDELFFDTGFQWAVRTPQWKLRWADGESGQRRALQQVEHTDIGEGRHLHSMTGTVSEAEADDLIDAEPDVAARLEADLVRWRESLTG